MVDGRVGLDRVDEAITARQGRNRAPNRRDDADRERVGVPERATDRSDGLADDDAARVAERHRIERVQRRIDPDHADIVVEVVPDDGGGHAVTVRELDVHGVRRRRTAQRRPGLACGRDHVRIREDHAARADDEARALAGARIGHVAGVEVGDDRHDTGRAPPVDLRRREAVPRERLRDDHGGSVTRARRRLGDDDGPGRARAEPAGRLADDQHGRAAEHGSNQGDTRDRTRTHRRPTVAASPGPCRELAPGRRLRRFHIFQGRDAGSPRAGSSSRSWALALRTSVNRVQPPSHSSSIRPPITSASSRAIARPSPLPEARPPSSR